MNELTGTRFGRLTLSEPCIVARLAAWRCVCDCGSVVAVRRKSLLRGDTRSCGCLRREKCASRARQRSRNYFGESHPSFAHGESVGGTTSPEYNSFRSAKGRCTNPRNAKFHRYGGRGIEFRFSSFAEFLADVGRRPGPGYSLDRIDNNGHYERGNVRWATYTTQARNRYYDGDR